ncbi:secretin N-terminal domain-containing protein [Nitratifractor sp.]
MFVKYLKSILAALLLGVFFGNFAIAEESCDQKLFNVTITDELTIKDAIDNLAETCGLTVVVKDSGASHRMKKKLYYVKLKNATLKSFLDTVLKDNDLNYTLRGNKLTISYLVTRTFKVHYVAGKRSGTSKAGIDIAKTGSNSDTGDKSASINITTDQEFKFWSTVKQEIHRILNTAGDGSIHFTKVADGWIGPDGQKWEYNPLEPIVNPEAGMITVTGTARQIERVSRYIATLTHQLKTEVLIDVRILDVKLSNGKTTGVDWNKIYNLNIPVSGSFNWNKSGGLIDRSSGISMSISGDLTGFMKFLKSQGDVTILSSPRVMTLNNQPAMITAGKQIWYKYRKTTPANNGGNTVSEEDVIDSVFAGILLDITPEVDERGMVTLKVNPSISTVADGQAYEERVANGDNSLPPNLQRRQIASVIKVRDGDHAVIGGLITRTKQKTVSKVPLLGRMPVLGGLFKREETTDVTDELVIIITPHIIRNRNVSLKELGYTHLR